MNIIQAKRNLLKELLELYEQRDFVKNDTAGKESINAIIKGKEDKFIQLVEEERHDS